MRKYQSGIMLLEALIAILIFSLGVLGVVGLQASSFAASRDAQYRTDAGLLANDLIGQMYSGNRDGVSLQNTFQGDCDDSLACSLVVDRPAFIAWRNRVSDSLPGVAVNPPIVYVGAGCAPDGVVGVTGPPATSTQVCITVRWMAPNETVAHFYRVIVQII